MGSWPAPSPGAARKATEGVGADLWPLAGVGQSRAGAATGRRPAERNAGWVPGRRQAPRGEEQALRPGRGRYLVRCEGFRTGERGKLAPGRTTGKET